MGSDSILGIERHSITLFQSTLPGWGATITDGVLDRIRTISIHAPRMGSDHAPHPRDRGPVHFNPRSPDGERLYAL